MEDILFERIKELCRKHNVSVSKLESDLGFGSSSIRKWGASTSPSIDKIRKVARYFNVSIEYLIGETDIESTADEILKDEAIISFQRARTKMTPKDREKSMQILKIGFDYAFAQEEGENEE